MQGIQFESWKVEVGIPNFLLRATLQPRGDLMLFLNNFTYNSYSFSNVELLPLASDYQIKGVKQPMMAVNRAMMAFISILEPDKAAQIQILQAKRQVVFYTEWFAIRGDLHVNSETPDDNLFDDKFEFFILTDATLYPLRPMNHKPTPKVPALAINRKTLLAYHTHKS